MGAFRSGFKGKQSSACLSFAPLASGEHIDHKDNTSNLRDNHQRVMQLTCFPQETTCLTVYKLFVRRPSNCIVEDSNSEAYGLRHMFENHLRRAKFLVRSSCMITASTLRLGTPRSVTLLLP